MLRTIKKLMKPLSHTPLHPQWLGQGGQKKLINQLKQIEKKSIFLDIGCFNKWPQNFISDDCQYVGLDYLETAKNWYYSLPDIYGDATQLPIASETIDVVLLLDVLEHISGTDQVFTEVYRVLKPNGQFIIQVPFLYPLHDEPRDYVRLTEHGLKAIAAKHHFVMAHCQPIGHPIETALLLTNLALTKMVLNALSQQKLISILILVLPFLILTNNLVGKLLAWVGPKDSFMPYTYQIVLIRH